MAPTRLNVTNVNRLPPVLTYHPFNSAMRKILLEYFNILSTDPETRGIFPEPPLLLYWREKNLRDFLIHSTRSSQRPFDADSFPCRRSRCQTCQYITSQTVLHGPKSSHNIHICFTCQSASLAAVAPAYTSVRPEDDYGNASVSTCVSSATGLLAWASCS